MSDEKRPEPPLNFDRIKALETMLAKAPPVSGEFIPFMLAMTSQLTSIGDAVIRLLRANDAPLRKDEIDSLVGAIQRNQYLLLDHMQRSIAAKRDA